MTEAQFAEGLAYAEDNFKNDHAPHLKVDKKLIKETMNLNGKKVLDFGCGMGGMSLWYATNWNCEVYALDIDSHHIKIAKTLQEKYQVQNVTFDKRNILDEPLTEKYDMVFLNDVAEHIQFPILEAIMKQLHQSLSATGKIFVSYPPWQGPYASHVSHIVNMPWCQYLPEKMLLKMIEKNNETIVGDLESSHLEAYKGLNHLNHGKLLNVVQKAKLKPTFRKSHSIINRVSPLKNVNLRIPPFDFLVTKEFVMLEPTN